MNLVFWNHKVIIPINAADNFNLNKVLGKRASENQPFQSHKKFSSEERTRRTRGKTLVLAIFSVEVRHNQRSRRTVTQRRSRRRRSKKNSCHTRVVCSSRILYALYCALLGSQRAPLRQNKERFWLNPKATIYSAFYWPHQSERIAVSTVRNAALPDCTDRCINAILRSRVPYFLFSTPFLSRSSSSPPPACTPFSTLFLSSSRGSN